MILVTGAGGHLGANLVRRLIASGQPVRAALFDARELPTVKGLDLDLVFGDLSNPEIAAAAVRTRAPASPAYRPSAMTMTSAPTTAATPRQAPVGIH